MAGIVSYGAYIPFNRLERQTIATAWGKDSMGGERSVANYDEDSVTMATAAVIDCLRGIDRTNIDGLYFATTSAPYGEKQSAAIIATAADLREDIMVADFTNSLRSGTQALRAALDAVNAGSARNVIVVASDCRLAAPMSALEQIFGDGAAAFLIGKAGVIADISDINSYTEEFIHLWRSSSDSFTRAWERPFIESEGYTRNLLAAVPSTLKKCHLSVKDFAKVVSCNPTGGKEQAIMKRLGFDAKTQIQDTLFNQLGNAGCAAVPMMLVAALEEANDGDKILVINYGDGYDACILQVTEQIGNIVDRQGIKGHLQPRQLMTYEKYLRFRRIVPTEEGEEGRGEAPTILVPELWREREQQLRLYGARCNHCGTLQYPMQRVCAICQTRDNYEKVRLSDKIATVFNYNLDNLAPTLDPPLIRVVVDFEGSGRMLTIMIDSIREEIKVGMPVEMTFRKLEVVSGITKYSWKCKPVGLIE